MKNVIALICFLGVSVFSANAQMPAAKRTPWDITKKVELKMTGAELWKLFHNSDSLTKMGNGSISKVEFRDPETFPSIKILLADGTVRVENVDQDEAQNTLIVLSRSKESLPRSIDDVKTGIFISEAGAGSSLTWRVQITGDKKAKALLISTMEAELAVWTEGLKKMDK